MAIELFLHVTNKRRAEIGRETCLLDIAELKEIEGVEIEFKLHATVGEVSHGR